MRYPKCKRHFPPPSLDNVGGIYERKYHNSLVDISMNREQWNESHRNMNRHILLLRYFVLQLNELEIGQILRCPVDAERKILCQCRRRFARDIWRQVSMCSSLHQNGRDLGYLHTQTNLFGYYNENITHNKTSDGEHHNKVIRWSLI